MALLLRRANISAKKFLIPDNLTHAAGTISAVFGSATYSVALSSLGANSLYYLYIVPGGTLVFSANPNSLGPMGYTSWMLVGAFMSTGNSPVVFGSFINIDGVPTSDAIIQAGNGLIFTGFGSPPAVVEGHIMRRGQFVHGRFYIRANTTTAADARFTINNLTINALAVQNLRRTYFGDYKAYSAVSTADFGVGTFGMLFYNPTYANEIELTDSYQPVSGEGQPAQIGADSILGSGNSISGWFDNIPITGWSNKSLKDL